MKQTAVEWLLKKIENKNGIEFSSYYTEFIEQAKQMEKEQIRNAYNNGYFAAYKYKDWEEYYKQTYNLNHPLTP